MSLAKTTARDWELGVRPTCNACGCELDPETDCHHDGYRGSPHAHNGRGSYGCGSHHYVFSELCQSCSETRIAPLRAILEYDSQTEWLECGHTHGTPYDRFGRIRSGQRRRCDKCRTALALDFQPVALVKKLNLKAKVRRNLLPPEVKRHNTQANWRRLALRYLDALGMEETEVGCLPYAASWFTVADLRVWCAKVATDAIYSNDDH